MSLLNALRIPPVRAAARRPLSAMSMSSYAGPSRSMYGAEPTNTTPFSTTYFDAFGDATPQDTSRPPAAPSTAYPPPNPAKANPEKEVKDYIPPPEYKLYVQATRNNCIIGFSHPDGRVLKTWTCGTCGFKKVNRSTSEAAYQTAVTAFKQVEAVFMSDPKMVLHIFFSGFGKGREAVQRAVLSAEGQVVRPLVWRVTDRTPIKVGGNRAKKMRRL